MAPPNTGGLVKAGSTLHLNMHYTPNGRETVDSSQLGVWFYPEGEEPDESFTLAKNSLVALLVVGDPLQATTHVDLQLRAQEAGIDCRVIHGISITTVVTGAIGLSNYKFGRQTTLTYPYGDWIATSPLEVLASNSEQHLHTLALLDLDPTGLGTGDQRPMRPEDAVQSMRLMWERLQKTMN